MLNYGQFYRHHPVYLESYANGGWVLEDNYGAIIARFETTDSLRSCTQWLKTPEAIAHVTRFYERRDGRQGEIRAM